MEDSLMNLPFFFLLILDNCLERTTVNNERVKVKRNRVICD